MSLLPATRSLAVLILLGALCAACGPRTPPMPPPEEPLTPAPEGEETSVDDTARTDEGEREARR